MREKSPDVVWPMWIGLSASEREDVFHYLVGFEEGGYMADSGVTCEKPIDQFPASGQRKRWSQPVLGG